MSLVFSKNNIQTDLNHSTAQLMSKKDNVIVTHDHASIVSDYLKEKIKAETIIINASSYFSLISTFSPIQSLSSLYITDAADYLKNIPGFASIRSGGTNADLVFRGMFGSRMRVLIDNGEMLGACCSRMDPPSSYIYPEAFDILNLVKGPQTVLLGPVSSGGILQFERYHPRFEASKIELRSSILVGSNNKVDKNIDSVIGSENGYIRIIGNVSHSDDYRDGNRCKVHSAWYKWNSDAIISVNFSPYTSYEISLGQGNGIANYATGIMDGLCLARESYRMKIETIDISNTLDKMELFFWYNYVNHVMGDSTSIICNNTTKKIDKHCGSGCTDSNIDRCVWGARGIAINQWASIECHSGVDMQINQHRKIQCDNTWCTDFITKDFGIFSELVLNAFENRKFIGGIRLEHLDISNDVRKNFIYRRYSTIYPAGFVRYEYNFYPLLYYVGMGTSQRFPDYWELYDIKYNKNIDISFNTLNQLLKPERTFQIDAGINFQYPKINGWVSSYLGYVKSFILHHYGIANKETSNVNYINNVDAKICGAEAELNYQFNETWCVTSNVMWAYGLNIDNDCSLPKIPPLEGKLMCKWKYSYVNMSLLWRLVMSSQFDLMDVNVISNNQIKSTDRNIKIPGFGVLSVNLMCVDSKYYKLSVGIDNILNRSYTEYLNVCNFKRLRCDEVNTPVYEPGRVWWIKTEIVL